MRRLAILVFLLLIPLTSADIENERTEWSKDLENGYISTAPIIVDDMVIVRTSGLWTDTDRPHIHAFNIYSGEELWKVRNNNSTNHDMAPLLFVNAGTGSCGTWGDMIIVGWTDGLVEALSPSDGSKIWDAHTEVITWGITGAMAVDEDQVVVPTRQGLSTYCLADGELGLRVDLPQLGWRNGVTITDAGYSLGNEEGILNTISRNGEVTNLTIGDGKIRHAPIELESDFLVHLQTENGSEIRVGDNLFSTEGSSPAIPAIMGNSIFLGTSAHVIELECNPSCVEKGRTEFHTNGEIAIQHLDDGNYSVWFSNNIQDGGWGIGIPGAAIAIHNAEISTYTTAAPAFKDDIMIFGNDAGTLAVSFDNLPERPESSIEKDPDSDNSNLVLLAIIAALVITFIAAKRDEAALKIGLPILLILAIIAQPYVAEQWSNSISDSIEPEGDWDDEWPDEWKTSQVIVFEMPDGERVVGELSGYTTVEEITMAAAESIGLNVETERFDIGTWVESFDEIEGSGWEFTVDGERSMVGMSEATLTDTSVVRWIPA